MMNIKGIGTDLIEVSRINDVISKKGQAFIDKLFTKDEQEYCKKHKNASIRFAGRFAAKEAISKAFGYGFGSELLWKDIEILNDENGKPDVRLSPALIKKYNNPKIFLSLSHTDNYATATAIWL